MTATTGASAAAAAGVRAGAIVFTDIVGFTELTDLHGDDVAVQLVERQLAIVDDERPTGSRVVKELGDGLLLWIDDAGEAIETACRLQRRFAAASTDDLPMWVRIGMHWGSPKRRGDDIIGRDVNLAARIADLAGPGEVLCTERLATVASAGTPGGDAMFHALGAVFVKGFADAVPVFRVEDVSCASRG